MLYLSLKQEVFNVRPKQKKKPCSTYAANRTIYIYIHIYTVKFRR